MSEEDKEIQKIIDELNEEEIKEIQEVKTEKQSFVTDHPIVSLVIAILIFIPIAWVFSVFTFTNLLQQFLFSVERAALYVMVCVGLTLTTRVLKFANFAHAEFLTIGVYTGLVITSFTNASEICLGDFCLDNIFLLSIFIFIITGAFAVLGEKLIFGPLRKRNATPLSLMVASIGFGLVIRQLVSDFFGGRDQKIDLQYPPFFDKVGSNFESIPVLKIFSIWFSERVEFSIIGTTKVIAFNRNMVWKVTMMIILVVLLQLLFKKTTLGISMRATADDIDLAQISGINTQRIIDWTWFIAGGVTGVGALFFLGPQAFVPFSGFAQLLIIFAVVTLGGFDSFEGTIVSAFIISAIQTMTILINSNLDPDNPLVFWSPNKDWSLVGPFATIIVVLIFRPRGLFGLVDPKSKL